MPGPEFLNVDLEIISASKLDSLEAEMGERVFVLTSEPITPRRYVLVVESNRIGSRRSRMPDPVIHALCSVVESLSPASRRTWQKAHKTFDVGYDLMPTERFSRFSVCPDTLERIAKLGASLTVTYYNHGVLMKLEAKSRAKNLKVADGSGR